MASFPVSSRRLERSRSLIHWIHLLITLSLPFVFVTGFTPAFLPVKSALLVLGGVALGLASLYWIFSRGEAEIVFRHEHLYLIGFILWMMLSILWSPNFFGALGEWLPLLAAGMVWFSWSVFYSNDDPDNRLQFEVIQTVVLVGLLESIIVLIQYFGLGLRFTPGVIGKWRVIGTFGNPNYVAEFLVPVFFLALNLLHHETRSVYRKFYLFSIFFLILAIAATWSRTGWLLLAGGLVLYTWIFTRKSRQRIFRMLLLIMARGRLFLASLALVLVLILLVFPFIRIDRALMQHASNTESISGRFFIWEKSLSALVSHLPFGAGIGGYAKAWTEAQYQHFSSGDDSGVNHAWVNDRAHNDFLQFSVEGGLGVIFILLFFARILRKGAGSFKHNDLSIGIFVALLSLLISSLANFPFRVPPNLWLIMFLAALVSQHRQLTAEKVFWRFDLARHRGRLLTGVLLFSSIGLLWSVGHVVSASLVRAGDEAQNRNQAQLAIDRYRLATSFDPGNPRAHVRLASLLEKVGSDQEAGIHAKRSLEILPFPEAWLIASKVASSSGSNQQSVALLEKRSTTYRKFPDFAADTIRGFINLGEVDKAFDEVKRLNKLIKRIDLPFDEWLPSILEANGAVVAARLEMAGQWIPAISERNPLFVDQNLIWRQVDDQLICFQEIDDHWKAVQAINLDFDFRVSSILGYEGDLYLAGSDGLQILAKGTEAVRRVKGVRGEIKDLARSAEALWLLGDDELIRYQPATGLVTNLRAVEGQDLTNLSSLAVLNDRVVVTSEDRFYSFDLDLAGGWEKTPWILRDGLALNQDWLLLLTDDRLCFWRSGQTNHHLSLDHDLPQARIVDLRDGVLTISDGRQSREIRLENSVSEFPSLKNNSSFGQEFRSGFVGFYKGSFFVAGLADGIRPLGFKDEGLKQGPISAGFIDERALVLDGRNLFLTQGALTSLTRLNHEEGRLVITDDQGIFLVNEQGLYGYNQSLQKFLITPDANQISCLASDQASLLVGYRDGRLLGLTGELRGLRKKFDSPLTALGLDQDAIYLGLSGQGVFRLDRSDFESRLFLDALAGLDLDRITAIYPGESLIYVGSGARLIVIDKASGSLNKLELESKSQVRAISSAPVGFGEVLIVFDDELVFLGKKAEVLLRLKGGRRWPKNLTTVQVKGQALILAGETGVLLVEDVYEVLKPWEKYFRGNQ